MARFPLLVVAFTLARELALQTTVVLAEEPANEAPKQAEAESPPPAGAGEGEADDGSDETKALLKQLTITMVSEVIDAHTVEVRDTKKSGKSHLRLGNVAPPDRGELSEADHEKKLAAAKSALEKLVGKQMIWWKPAKEEFQPAQPDGGPPLVVGDMWLMDGRHLNSGLLQAGHLKEAKQYEEELARNILTAEADEKKKEAYKELEAALKASAKEEAAKLKEAKKAKKAADAKAKEEAREPMSLGLWVGFAVIGVIMVGVMTNFGRGSTKKKVNLNKKRGFLQTLWSKVKGS